MSIVRYRPHELPPITAERQQELRELAARPDSEIDYSDIPPLDDGFWARSMPNPFHAGPAQVQASVRLDADIFAWLQRSGEEFQARMNAILRQAMLNERKQAPL